MPVRNVPAFELAARFGVRLVVVDEHLPLPVMYDHRHELAFVSSHYDHDELEAGADWLLSRLARDQAPRS